MPWVVEWGARLWDCGHHIGDSWTLFVEGGVGLCGTESPQVVTVLVICIALR